MVKLGHDGHPIPEKQGIVTATIKPILLGDLKLPRMFACEAPPIPESKVMADVDHPITKALMEGLPRMSNPDLKRLRAMLLDPERGGAYSSSKQIDIDSWVGLVDLEIEYRKREGSKLFETILHLFQKKAG